MIGCQAGLPWPLGCWGTPGPRDREHVAGRTARGQSPNGKHQLLAVCNTRRNRDMLLLQRASSPVISFYFSMLLWWPASPSFFLTPSRLRVLFHSVFRRLHATSLALSLSFCPRAPVPKPAVSLQAASQEACVMYDTLSTRNASRVRYATQAQIVRLGSAQSNGALPSPSVGTRRVGQARGSRHPAPAKAQTQIPDSPLHSKARTKMEIFAPAEQVSQR